MAHELRRLALHTHENGLFQISLMSMMRVNGDFGPSTPGMDLTEHQTPGMLGAVIALMIIGTLAVILRIYIRVRTSQTNFGLDDLLIFAALVSLSCRVYLVRAVNLSSSSLPTAPVYV